MNSDFWAGIEFGIKNGDAGRGITVPVSDYLGLRITLTFEIELQLDCEGFAGVDILDYGYVLSREREDWAEW